MNDGAQVALDWTVGEKQLGDDSKTPVLVVLHGLTGGSHESYIQGVLEKVRSCTASYFEGILISLLLRSSKHPITTVVLLCIAVVVDSLKSLHLRRSMGPVQATCGKL
jgi:predicted alpha/beta-fold hydrolase